jgi:glucose-1-phosphate adenylyltransferase
VASDVAADMGIFRFDRTGNIVAFEEKPDAARLVEIERSIPVGALFGRHSPERPFMASMGIYVFSRNVLFDMLEREAGVDFGRELIPNALDRYTVKPYLVRDYWADVGSIPSFYDANIMVGRPTAPFRFFDARRPIYTHMRQLPGTRLTDARVRHSILAEGCFAERCEIDGSTVGIRTNIRRGARISRSVLLGADRYEDGVPRAGLPPLGIGRDVVLDRVIVDKNARIGDGARLVNERGIDNADGDGYCIRGGIVVVPKGGVIKPETVV